MAEQILSIPGFSIESFSKLSFQLSFGLNGTLLPALLIDCSEKNCFSHCFLCSHFKMFIELKSDMHFQRIKETFFVFFFLYLCFVKRLASCSPAQKHLIKNTFISIKYSVYSTYLFFLKKEVQTFSKYLFNSFKETFFF